MRLSKYLWCKSVKYRQAYPHLCHVHTHHIRSDLIYCESFNFWWFLSSSVSQCILVIYNLTSHLSFAFYLSPISLNWMHQVNLLPSPSKKRRYGRNSSTHNYLKLLYQILIISSYTKICIRWSNCKMVRVREV